VGLCEGNLWVPVGIDRETANSRSKRGNMWAEEGVKVLDTGGAAESMRAEKLGTPRDA